MLFALGAAKSGIVHAGLDPDDVLVLADGRLAILDFGATCEVRADRGAATASALEAFASGDEDRSGDALSQLGWLPSSRAPGALALAHDVLAELAGPGGVRLDTSAVLAARDRLLDRPEALGDLILFGGLPPQDLWPARGVAQLFGTIARVGASGDWVELARAALRDGWDARPT